MIEQRIVADPGVEGRRSELRIGVHATISLRELGATATRARLVNISSKGFMAEVDDLIGDGSRIWLTIPGMDRINALVIWSRGCRIGGTFSAPVDPLAILQAIGREATLSPVPHLGR
jgi:PilZ domain-containing protein